VPGAPVSDDVQAYWLAWQHIRGMEWSSPRGRSGGGQGTQGSLWFTVMSAFSAKAPVLVGWTARSSDGIMKR
jgi:hypothetical protein